MEIQKLKFISSNEIFERYSKGERDFSNYILNGISLTGSNLEGVVFKNCWIKGVQFARCNLMDANFEGSTIDNFGSFINLNLTRANFKNTKIHFIYFENVIFGETNFSNADLFWCGFPHCNRDGADLAKAKVTHVYWDFDNIDVVKAIEAALPHIMKSDLPESTKIRIKSYANTFLDQVKSEKKSTYDVKVTFGKIMSEMYFPRNVKNATQYGTDNNQYSQKVEYGIVQLDKKKANSYKVKK